MSKRETLTTLHQIKGFAEEAAALSAGRSKNDLVSNLGLRRHAERVIELIGEACSRLPESVLERHPEIPWRQIVGMRNWLAHGYDGIDYDILWDAVSRHVRDLHVKIESLIGEIEQANTKEAERDISDDF